MRDLLRLSAIMQRQGLRPLVVARARRACIARSARMGVTAMEFVVAGRG
jgi:hypothetical protein